MAKLNHTLLAALVIALLSAAGIAQVPPAKTPASSAKTTSSPGKTPAVKRPAASRKPPATTPAPVVRKIDPASFYPLLEVRVEGNQRLVAEKVTALSGLKSGTPVNQDSFSAAHLALMDTGLFETVSYRFEKPAQQEGYIVTFQVTETDLFYPIRFEEIPAERDDILAHLSANDPAYDSQSAATEPALKRYSKLIESFLATRGTELKVRGVVWAEQGGALSVMYRPDSAIPSVSDVRFEGSTKIEPIELRRILIQTATGILFTEDRFRTILNNEIVPAYWAIGHLGVKFPKIEATPLTEEKGVRVMVTVDEGPEFTLNSARIATSVFPEEELLRVAKFPVGESARMKIVADGTKEILNRYKRQGYVNATAKFEPALDFEEKSADLTVAVDEGEQYLFRELKIRGLDLVNEAGIRKLWSMEPGKPFNSLYPDFFLEQLKERQMMEALGKTTAEVHLDERAKEATVTLVFKAPDLTPPPRTPLVRPQ